MTARSAPFITAALLLAAPLLRSPLGAQGLEYATGSNSYHVTIATRGTQTSPMGVQDFEIAVRERLTVDVARPAKDTLVATVTLDSLSLTSAGPTPDVGKYQGTRFVSRLSPTGRVYSTRSPDAADGMLSQLAESITRFLPTYRPDLRVGQAWSDTTSDKVMQQGMEVSRTVVADYRVAGDTMVAGEKAYRITRRSTMKAAGSGTANGSAVGLTSASTSDATLLVSAKGVYLAGDAKDDIDLKVTIGAQGPEISIRQSAVQTVRRTR